MAENIYTDIGYHSLVMRINALTEYSAPHWGKMDLPQMLEHCAIQLKMALGILPNTIEGSPLLYRTLVGRWLSLYVVPWPRGFETPAIMDMLTNNMPVQDFENEKTHLLFLLKEIRKETTLAPHHFYGDISKKDWGRLIWVHLDHHLRQFGQ